MNHPPIPEYMMPALERYIERGCHPGGFLTAVLASDLFKAVDRGDSQNVAALPSYVIYLYNHAPSDCWGSYEKVRDWIAVKTAARASLVEET